MAAIADVVVVAAGASRRMGGVDKILAPLAGRPLLAWTLGAIRAARSVRRVVLVVGAERAPDVVALSWVRDAEVTVVAGGERRQDSVAAGVRATDAPLVLVHDAARPLASPALFDAVVAATQAHGAAIPVLTVTETLKAVEGDRVVRTVSRVGLATAQTPQGASRALLEASWVRVGPGGEREFTDEAALLEAAGVEVRAVRGEAGNVKVTYPEDLARAEALLLARAGAPRTGYGHDSHPFGPDDGLRLGGIEIPDAPRLQGHSDGDVALHALADALLGASGSGDLGRLFPAGDPRIRGVASVELVRPVVDRLYADGWLVRSVDLTITAARPRLAGRLDRMRDAIATLLRVEPGCVNVKASSGNLDGPEGEGRSISATAVATLARLGWPTGDDQ